MKAAPIDISSYICKVVNSCSHVHIELIITSFFSLLDYSCKITNRCRNFRCWPLQIANEASSKSFKRASRMGQKIYSWTRLLMVCWDLYTFRYIIRMICIWSYIATSVNRRTPHQIQVISTFKSWADVGGCVSTAHSNSLLFFVFTWLGVI